MSQGAQVLALWCAVAGVVATAVLFVCVSRLIARIRAIELRLGKHAKAIRDIADAHNRMATVINDGVVKR